MVSFVRTDLLGGDIAPLLAVHAPQFLKGRRGLQLEGNLAFLIPNLHVAARRGIRSKFSERCMFM